MNDSYMNDRFDHTHFFSPKQEKEVEIGNGLLVTITLVYIKFSAKNLV